MNFFFKKIGIRMIINRLFHGNYIIIGFLIVQVITILDFMFRHGEAKIATELLTLRLILLLAYVLLAYFAGKGNRLAWKFVSIIITAHGGWMVTLGILAFSSSQYILKMSAIVLGVYFTCGGILLFRQQFPQGRRTGN